MLIGLLVFIILLAYWIIVQQIKKRELNTKLKHFPGTNSDYPLLGDVHVWSIMKWSLDEKIKHFIEVLRKYPTTVKLWFGSKVVVVINNPEDIKTVLTSPHCTDKSSVYRMAIGGDGIFIANGQIWKTQRRHLNTTFGPNILNSYANEYNRFGRNIVTTLNEHVARGKEFDITPIFGINVTDLLIRTIYGSTQQNFERSKHCYALVERLMIFWGERMLQIYFHIILFVFQKIFKMQSEDKKLNRELRDGLQPIFDQKIDEYKNNQNGVSERSEHFLEKLTRLRFEEVIGLSAYRHTSMTMFLAGAETTARSSSVIILMLAVHQEYQQKIYEEICNFYQVHGDHDLDVSKLGELDLLDRFIKETFRLFPIVPLIGRTPSHDIPLKEGILPAGTDILISTVNIHRQPSIWGENFMEFNPDNFLPEAVANRDKCTYLPFSYGPRNCIGYKFAQMAVYTGVIHLLKNYKFKTTIKVEDIQLGYALTTYLLNENLVSIESRNFNGK